MQHKRVKSAKIEHNTNFMAKIPTDHYLIQNYEVYFELMIYVYFDAKDEVSLQHCIPKPKNSKGYCMSK